MLSARVDVPAGPKPNGHCKIVFSDDGQEAIFHDGTGHLQTENVAQLSTDPDGRRVIDLAIRLRNVGGGPPPPWDVNNLTVKLRLDVKGDGTTAQQGADASIVVPRTKAGVRELIVRVVRRRELSTEDRQSYELTHIG